MVRLYNKAKDTGFREASDNMVFYDLYGEYKRLKKNNYIDGIEKMYSKIELK